MHFNLLSTYEKNISAGIRIVTQEAILSLAPILFYRGLLYFDFSLLEMVSPLERS
jgi:hypothetical protein